MLQRKGRLMAGETFRLDAFKLASGISRDVRNGCVKTFSSTRRSSVGQCSGVVGRNLSLFGGLFKCHSRSFVTAACA